MSVRRRDRKGRILRNGESQSKDGRYRFTYYENKKQKCLYSWKLEPTDKLPVGKKDCVALRDQILDLRRRQYIGGMHNCQMTVVDLVERYIRLKTGVRASTRAGYKTVLNFLKRDAFGNRKIVDIRTSEAKIWLIQLQENGKSYSSIHTIRGVLRPAFQMAVEDDILLKNPFEFQLETVIVNDSATREAVTREQERKFLEFVKNDRHYCRYYEGIFILFKTGMRISEFCGLTKRDIDLRERTITIDHQLLRTNAMEYIIEKPKTAKGNRVIPMTPEVYECFKTILKNRKIPAAEPMVDGKAGFLYLDRHDMPMVALHWEKYFEHLVNKYNRIYREQMPKITPHVCRHTYCSNMAKSGMNPKTLQYLMGHSDISVTLDIYTHYGFNDAKLEVERLQKVAETKCVDETLEDDFPWENSRSAMMAY